MEEINTEGVYKKIVEKGMRVGLGEMSKCVWSEKGKVSGDYFLV